MTDQPAGYTTSRDATMLAIKQRDCPWCIAKAGELCYADAGGGRVTRSWSQTHTGRFAGLGSPSEFLARNRGAVPDRSDPRNPS